MNAVEAASGVVHAHDFEVDMKISGQSIVWWNFTIDLAEFPALLAAFDNKEFQTRDLETQGLD